MHRATNEIRSFCLRLMTQETKGHHTPEAIVLASFHTFEKMKPQLTTLMGNGGFRALMTRALMVVKEEIPWMTKVRLGADGTLEATGRFESKISPQQLIQGSSVLLAQLVGLLVAFIGEKLTIRLIQEVWPKLKISETEFENKGIYEK